VSPVPVQRPAEPVPRDPGLQPERTALAWSRTGFALLVNALLALRAGWTVQSVPITGLGVLLLMCCAGAIAYGALRRRHLAAGLRPLAPPALAIWVAAAVMMLACATGVASIWMGRAGGPPVASVTLR
jgi:uncharacterized membrane protein YidH (DUF202 family)